VKDLIAACCRHEILREDDREAPSFGFARLFAMAL